MVQGSLYDPFDTDTIGSTWTAWGSPTVHDIDSTIPGNYYIQEAAAAGVSLSGIFRTWTPTSNGDYVETWITDAQAAHGNYVCGLFIGEAGGAGKVLTLFFNDGDTANIPELGSYRYNSRTSFNATLFGPIQNQLRPPFGLRIKRETGTTVFGFYFSQSGRLWTPISATFDPSMTVGIAGLFTDTNDATGIGIEAAFEYFNGIQGGA